MARLPNIESPPQAVILVGGPGTRLRPLTYETPKSMVPVLNRPFMAHMLAYLKQFGIEDIVLALNYLPEVIQEYFGDGSRAGVRLCYCVEGKPMGTAGAVKNAERYLSSTLIVLNGDIFTDLNIADMLAFHRNQGAMATISLSWVDNPGAYGVVEIDHDKRVKSFIEKPPPDQATTHWINAGTYILEPEVLEYVPANSHYMFERGLFPLLLEMGKPVYGYPDSGYWLDMGTPEKYLALNCDLLLSRTRSPLTSVSDKDGIHCGRNVTIHPSARVAAPAAIGHNCRISRGVHIKGPVVIGADCQIGEGAEIENAVLWSRVRIGANASIKQCIIGSNHRIEPDSQLAEYVITSSEKAPLSQP